MDQLLNALKAQSSSLDRAQAQPRFALVVSVDPARYAARVALQPEGVLTGWLPILSGWVGPGWGITCPPSPGDQVLVLAQEGDADNGVIIGSSFSDVARCPGAPRGELWLVHSSGSFLKLLNDGTVQLKGDLHVTGNVFSSGDVLAAGELVDGRGALSHLRSDYDLHTHGVPQGGRTEVPSLQD